MSKEIQFLSWISFFVLLPMRDRLVYNFTFGAEFDKMVICHKT